MNSTNLVNRLSPETNIPRHSRLNREGGEQCTDYSRPHGEVAAKLHDT